MNLFCLLIVPEMSSLSDNIKCLVFICSSPCVLSGSRSNQIKAEPFVEGGSPGAVAGLSYLDTQNPVANVQRYSLWARSVSFYPRVIKQKVRLLFVPLIKWGFFQPEVVLYYWVQVSWISQDIPVNIRILHMLIWTSVHVWLMCMDSAQMICYSWRMQDSFSCGESLFIYNV